VDIHRLLPQVGRDRRANPRYACDLRACYQARPASPAAPWQGCRVSDISAGGIALVVSRPCTTGTVLEIDLEGCMFTFPVRVAQASQQADGSWFLGCAFGQEFGLTDADLRVFLRHLGPCSGQNSERDVPAAQSPRCSTVSRQCDNGGKPRRRRAGGEHRRRLKAFCEAISSPPGPLWRPAKVRDLSTGGLSLTVRPGFEPGTVIGVNLHHTGNGFSCTLRACVTHAAVEGDEGCRIDCAFLDEPTELLKCFPRKRRAME
jgi:hypothetical protein